jgi:hypothetical protein
MDGIQMSVNVTRVPTKNNPSANDTDQHSIIIIKQIDRNGKPD